MLDSATHDVRTALHDTMRITLADEERYRRWIYAAVRPEYMPTAKRSYVSGLTVRGDCSKGCQYLDWWTPPAPDCMGNGFGPYGNSQTLCFHLRHISTPADLWVGDIVTFGSWGEEHAARVYQRGADPLLWSFGHQGAPNTYLLSYDRRPRQLLRAEIVATPMTPQEHLRAMTGWFAWVAWRLGEGSWQHYGPHHAGVRPNVPKRIPMEWFARLSQFMYNRKHGNAPTTHHLKEQK